MFSENCEMTFIIKQKLFSKNTLMLKWRNYNNLYIYIYICILTYITSGVN